MKMVSELVAQSNLPSVLEHDLERAFPDLLKFDSTSEMEKSVVYQSVKSEVEKILNAIVQENFTPDATGEVQTTIRALAWNLERGSRFNGIANVLKNHAQLKDKDLLQLTELDYGMARSGNRFVARELAEELKLNYVFRHPIERVSVIEFQ